MCTEFDTFSGETVLKDSLVDGLMWTGSIQIFKFKKYVENAITTTTTTTTMNMVLMCLLSMGWLVPAIIQMAHWSLTRVHRVLQSCCVTSEKRSSSCSRLTLTLVLQLNTSCWSINHFDAYFYSSCDAYTTRLSK